MKKDRSSGRPEGLTHGAAAAILLYLIKESFQRKLSGVRLKDEQPAELEHGNGSGDLSSPPDGKGE